MVLHNIYHILKPVDVGEARNRPVYWEKITETWKMWLLTSKMRKRDKNWHRDDRFLETNDSARNKVCESFPHLILSLLIVNYQLSIFFCFLRDRSTLNI